MPKRLEIGPQKNVRMNVCSSIIHNSWKLETAQMCINWWMDKQCVIHLDNGSYSARKNEVLTQVTVQMNLQNIMLSKIFQTQKAT